MNDVLEIVLLKHKEWLEKGKWSPANLRGADLWGANLSEANLSEANLSRANLRVANLLRADLSGADLSGANLSGAYLWGADLSGANLSGANLSGHKPLYADTKRNYVLYVFSETVQPFFVAGCRTFTRSEALKHWGPDSKRAQPKYVEAIERWWTDTYGDETNA